MVEKRKTKRKLKTSVKIILGIFLFSIFILTGFLIIESLPEDTGPEYGNINEVDIEAGNIEKGEDFSMEDAPFIFKVINVGQAQSLLISYGDMQVLIDGGYYETREKVIKAIKEYVTDGKIEYVIATHSHADHIGGLPEVYDTYKVEKTIYGDLLSGEEAVRYFREAVRKEETSFEEDTNTVIDLGKNASLTIYDIVDEDKDNINNNSIVTLIQYGETYFFASGDLEEGAEVLMRGKLPKCDVVVAGHHGASNANSLLDELKPDYFVISAGKNNDYGHPHESTLAKAMLNRNTEIYGTFRSGSITFKSDGMSVSCSADAEDELTILDAGAKEK